ncbi:hypothetical protein OG21DRAFT_1512248 [Imleria badia]|nr:hypothetical protein OG21DRAFT_1512248 [Imleria badia]
MATLKRCHTPGIPWGAPVEKLNWARSRRGTPRRRRSDRPPLTHDPGWDWDGTQILFTEKTNLPDLEERDREVCAFQRWEDDHSPVLSGRTHATLSLLGIARYQMTEKRSKARSGFGDFEVIRLPKVVPVSEEEPNLGDSSRLSEWETLDALGFKRTYSEVARSFVDGKDPPETPDSSRLAQSGTEDDSWEYL